MIINSVRAENVLKYSLLDLGDVPARGLIAVIGDNESGKSSIGESICFALFGRTFSLGPEELDKVIRWGESRCSIKLDFTTPDGQRYQVARFLDELGNHGASISRAGETPMIRGIEEVESALKDIIGFGYAEFVESFYLAQREITTPHPHSFAVKAMAGVDVLEKVVGNCADEAERSRQQAEETGAELSDIQAQIAALDLQEGHLESLRGQVEEQESALGSDRLRIAELKDTAEQADRITHRLRAGANAWQGIDPEASFDERRNQARALEAVLAEITPDCRAQPATAQPLDELAAAAADARERLGVFESLSARAAAYRGQLERLLGGPETTGLKAGEQTFAARQAELLAADKRTASGRRTAQVAMFVLLLLSLSAWGVTGLLGLAPESPQATALAEWLTSISANWRNLFQPWFILVACLLTVLFLVFMGRSIALGSQLQQLGRSREKIIYEVANASQEARDLAALDDMPLPDALAFLGRLRDETMAAHAAEFAQGVGAALIDPNEHARRREAFSNSAGMLEQGLAASKEAAVGEVDGLHESVAARSADIARLGEMIAHEEERVRKHRELAAIADNLSARVDELQHRIRVRELAADLLGGAIHYISQRFNTEVRNLAADSLPRFTNGRYEHLQIDENLKVKAFSNEKRNFMDLDEISSGTQRQIMLAVRLALSQKLVNSVIQGPQMLFLDEPFAFFDESRTASALAVLPEVSGDFTQIWVTSQTFPAASRFDMYVECTAAENRSPVVRRAE
jgi:exonuclease SbcC